MSLLNEVTTGIQIPAIKINVSGTDGIGKTTFASQAPKPIFIKTCLLYTSPSPRDA